MQPSIDRDEVAAAVRKFLADEQWAKVFYGAPSEAAQNRIALNFWVSENIDKPTFPRDVYLALRERLERGLTREDLQYLILSTDNEAGKRHFRQLLLALPDEADGRDAPVASGKEGGDGAL